MRVEHELIALPARRIQVQAHPASGAVVGRDGLLGTQEEAQVLAVVLDLILRMALRWVRLSYTQPEPSRVTGKITVVEGIIDGVGLAEAPDSRPVRDRQASEHRRVRHALVAGGHSR